MDDYKKIVILCIKAISLFIFTKYSYASVPDLNDIPRLIFLGYGMLFLAFITYTFVRDKRYFPTIFGGSLTILLSFAAEIRIMAGTFYVSSEVMLSKYSHAMVTYNVYRYVLIIFIAIIFLKDFAKKKSEISCNKSEELDF